LWEGLKVLFWRDRHNVREEDLSAYVDGELSASVLQRVEAHLETCEACRETITELRAVRQSVKELPHASAPRSFALREADVASAPTSGAVGLFGSMTPLLSGVAAIAMVAFVVLAGFDVSSNGSNDLSRVAGGTLASVTVESADQAPPDAALPQTSSPLEYDDADGGASPEALPGDGDFTLDGDSEEGAAPAVGDTERGGADDAERLGNKPQNLSSGDDNETGLRIAEAVAGGIAVVAGGAALFMWWRRRTVLE
jgi:hypothetical protein